MKEVDDILLPQASPNQDQEALSRKKFELLFDEERFELHPTIIDNGIDYRIEIKKGTNKLGFWFNFQLKSKEELKVNQDGSRSKTLETSNIEYLLNGGHPAYYGFYIKEEDEFYYRHLNPILRELVEKPKDWEDQPTHTLRFTEKVDKTAVDAIYDMALQHGKMLRKVNAQNAMRLPTANPDDKILIDGNLTVTTDLEVIQAIETIGIHLSNTGNWKGILAIHRRGSSSGTRSSIYNLVIAIAQYNTGSIAAALPFIRSAYKAKESLPPALQGTLTYFDAVIRHTLGILSEADFDDALATIPATDEIALYVELGSLKKQYALDLEADQERAYSTFSAGVEQLKQSPGASENLVLMAECELILLEGSRNNMNLVREISMINALESSIGPNMELRARAVRNMVSNNNAWHDRVAKLLETALASKNLFAYYNGIVNRAKVNHEFDVFTSLIHVNQTLVAENNPPGRDRDAFYSHMVQTIDEACAFFERVGHVENLIVGLSIKYEVLHYLGHGVEEVLGQMDSLVEDNDLTDQARRLEHLRNGGTTHQSFKNLVDSSLKPAEEQRSEHEMLVKAMTSMDDQERTIKPDFSQYTNIDLFPIGIFMVPRNQTEEALDLIVAQDESVRERFRSMWGMGVIPIANILTNVVAQEGYGAGRYADSGIESWRRVHSVRKAFFEKGFYRWFGPSKTES